MSDNPQALPPNAIPNGLILVTLVGAHDFCGGFIEIIQCFGKNELFKFRALELEPNVENSEKSVILEFTHYFDLKAITKIRSVTSGQEIPLSNYLRCTNGRADKTA